MFCVVIMLCDVFVDKGDGDREVISTHSDLSVWNIRQWMALFSVFNQTVLEFGYAKIVIIPIVSF